MAAALFSVEGSDVVELDVPDDLEVQADPRRLEQVVANLVENALVHGEAPVRVSARAVTVSGRDFHYRADAAALGPVRNRTWTVQPRAWRLTVPGQP